MSEPSLPGKIVALAEALDAARIPHAFGGALALAYYAEPRATIGIDLNLFLPPPEHGAVEKALAGLEVEAKQDPSEPRSDGQCRWWWGTTPLDLFFAYDPIHEAMREGTRRVPFGEDRIRVLGPEHLLVCKVAFDRPKDWLDIEQMVLLTPELDRDEVERWLGRLLAPDDPRHVRLGGIWRAPP